MKFTFYLPTRNEYKIIRAKDESIAVWKLLNHFRLIESQIMDYKIIKREEERNAFC